MYDRKQVILSAAKDKEWEGSRRLRRKRYYNIDCQPSQSAFLYFVHSLRWVNVI